jgi:hypothetical protein
MKLNLFFLHRGEYEKAKNFFENESDFYANEMCDELCCMVFNEDGDLDALEMALTDELSENNFGGFWFETA